jgi:LmbE family N-acetylglucosaminyl deacetylase
MKKLLFGIFAHPDDEAFGPAAFLYTQAHSDTDVHLVLITDGEKGTNPGYDNLAKTRLEEWLESGRRIGASSNYALHYPDGGLCNDLYLEISSKIQAHMQQVIANYHEPLELNFITFEERGVSGHLDHIAASFITTFIYEKLRQKQVPDTTLGMLRYYCLPKRMAKTCNCAWIYMPAGRDMTEIDEVISYEDMRDIKVGIMDAHASQKGDRDYVLAQSDTANCHEDNFIHYKG